MGFDRIECIYFLSYLKYNHPVCSRSSENEITSLCIMASHPDVLTLCCGSLCSRAKLTKQPPDYAVLMVNPELSWYFLAWVQCLGSVLSGCSNIFILPLVQTVVYCNRGVWVRVTQGCRIAPSAFMLYFLNLSVVLKLSCAEKTLVAHVSIHGFMTSVLKFCE